MKIRPKNSILYAATGVRFSSANAGGANWRQQVFNNYRQHLLDQLSKYGEANDYGDWLNEMQHRHSQLWNAANQSGNWEDIAYENEDVGRYQQDYRGGKGNDGNYQRFGTVQLNPEDKYDFNQTGIKTNQATRYNIPDPPKRISGDFSREGYDYRVDNYYSGITDDRRLLGRKGDWDENSQEYKDWIKQLNDRGWTMELDESDQYYKLKRLGTPDPNNPQQNPQQNPPENPSNPYSLVGNHTERYGFDWNKIGAYLKQYGPDLLAAGRLAGNLWNNERVFKESEKGIRPDLKQTYYTHRQVVGDEATKQGYYRRAAQGQTAAARPFTSDADRQMAYQMEAKRVGDEMRAQGDLADNQEIRRTSDESNQHQWANTQRATEVANANTAAINYANALRQNLRAQKQSADWTSIDNELLARETRLRQKQARNEAIQDQIWALDEQNKLQNDPEYLAAYDTYKKAYDEAVKKHTNSSGTDYTAVKSDPDFRRAQQNYQNIQYKYQRQQLESMLRRPRNYYAKDGMKFTFKSKDDLLYKTARDAAEHFRKMSKISSDGLNRKRIRIEKLTSHPKGNRKYQQGGVAPFTIYRPATVGGETGMTTQAGGTSATTSSKASSKKEGSDTLDMVKKLFETVAGKGLPSDVNTLYNQMQGFLARAEAFGSDLSTDDIASMYLSQMQRLNTIQYMKADFDKAKEKATSNEALDEFAVTLDGKVVVQNAKGEIKRMSWDEAKKNKEFNPLTNRQLLSIRALSPEYAFKNDGILDIVGNGIGMNKISEWIRTNLPTMGTSENKLEGYTKQESHKIIKGIEILKDAPSGDYKISELTKDQKDQAEAALKYIAGIMPRNMRAVLGIHADLSGTTPAELLTSLVSSKMSNTYQLDIDAVTGKAAKNSGDGSDIDSNKINTNPLLAMQREMGGVPQRYELITRDSNTRMSVNGTFYSALPKIKQDMSVDKMLSESGIQGILDSKYGITFGDQQIKPENLKDIMYSNTGGMVVTLPCKVVNGHKQINLDIREDYERCEQKALSKVGDRQSPEFAKVLAEELHNAHLDSLLDSNGNLNKNMFAQFLVVEAYTTDKIDFDRNSQYVEKVKNPDKQLETRLTQALSTDSKNSNYKIDTKDHWSIFEWTYDDVYRGTMFIPLNNNPNSAMNSWGNSTLKIDQSQDLEELYQIYNKSATYNSNNSL